MSHFVTEKLYCDACRKFLGLRTSDGCGPSMDACLADREKCPSVARLTCYLPWRRDMDARVKGKA